MEDGTSSMASGSMSPEPTAATAAAASPTTAPAKEAEDVTSTSIADAPAAEASSESADAATADADTAASAKESDTTADEEQPTTDAPAADVATEEPTAAHEKQDDSSAKEEEEAAPAAEAEEHLASAVAAETVDTAATAPAAAAEAPSDDAPTAKDNESKGDDEAAVPPPSEDVTMTTPSEDAAEPTTSSSPAPSTAVTTTAELAETDADAKANASNGVADAPAAPAAAAGKRKATESASSDAPQDDASAAPTKKQKIEANGSASVSTANGIKQEQPPVSSAPETPAASAAAVVAPSADVKPTISVDAAPIMLSRDDMAKQEEDGGLVKFDVITNDGAPEHLIQLTTLKNIFAKQLPKMPKEYIVRLVFDRNHRSMVILKNGTRVIGGICYRPFLSNHFAEIAFCAINAADQVKGYGTRLMNHLKEFVKRDGITHFLTYADNYAIGYFKKQGFAKVVSMPRPNWFGYIKDYDGGTLMECTIHHQINYLQITNMVHKQRKVRSLSHMDLSEREAREVSCTRLCVSVASSQAIQDKIKERSRAHVVYAGLEKFAEGRLMDIYMIPGVSTYSSCVLRL